MKNLAGNRDCDRDIRRELERARIDIVEGEHSTNEVPFSVTGRLGPFTFTRAWYYWVVEGPMPLEVALELYADPVGKVDVRVAGHCACPPPEYPWVTYYDAEGLQLYPDPDGKETRQLAHFLEKGFVTAEQMRRYRFVRGGAEEIAAQAARAVVESYHIDSEVGLRLFADTVRARVMQSVQSVQGEP